jgi:hypothetical protein
MAGERWFNDNERAIINRLYDESRVVAGLTEPVLRDLKLHRVVDFTFCVA